MIPFLKNTASQLWTKYGEKLSDINIVFPNKRSISYFSGYLKDSVSGLMMMPNCITINELFINQSNKIIADKLALHTLLYKSFKQESNTKELFEDFYPFACLLLNDFDTIDRYLINTQNLFRNISSIKSIDSYFSYLTKEQLLAIKQFWQCFDEKKISSEQKSFLQMWNVLGNVYSTFNNELDKQGIAYEGKIFKEVIEEIKAENISFTNSEYVFVGFNILSNSEKYLFQYLQKRKKALFFWDYNEDFIENKHNEAGIFIRNNIKDFPQVVSERNSKDISCKNFKHIKTVGEIQQAKVLGNILQKELLPDDYKHTAIVLANESTLLPLLSSLPKEITPLNISIGYSLVNTAWYRFINALTNMQNNIIVEGDTTYLMVSDFASVLHNRYGKEIAGEAGMQILQDLRDTNSIKIAFKNIPKSLKGLFIPISTPDQLTKYLNDLIESCSSFTKEQSEEQEALRQTIYIIRKMDIALAGIRVQKITLYFNLLLQNLEQHSMTFAQENADGVQVMSFLQTRLLDFKHIYILSCNEGYLPNITLPNSLIPYSLRIGSGLPTIKEQSSIYAYCFYRLLNHAENITMFSVSGAQDVGTKEQSRYITQLEFEAPYPIKTYVATASITPVKPVLETIYKDTEIQLEFKKYFERKRSISASSLNTYLRCPQSFYYRYISKIPEIKTTNKADDYNMFGSIFHRAAELLYLPHLHKEIDKSTLIRIGKTDNLQKILKKAFHSELFLEGRNQKLEGKELLIFDILLNYLKKLIAYDMNKAPFTILDLEVECHHDIIIKVNNKQETIKLYGIIDRIEKQGDSITTIDYKTGNVNRQFHSLELLFSPCNKYNNRTVMQAFLYGWIYSKQTGNIPKLCIYDMKNLHNTSNKSPQFVYGESRPYKPFNFKEYMDEYEKHLAILLGDIFGNELYFYRNESGDNKCSHDIYTGICNIF